MAYQLKLFHTLGLRVLIWPLAFMAATALAVWGVLVAPAPVVDMMLKQDITDQAEL